MVKTLCSCVVLYCAFAFFSPVASGRTPGDFFEVLSVTPSRVIDHHVDVQGPLDEAANETLLTGPQLFSHAVGFGDNTARDQRRYLNWYKITRPKIEQRRILSVRDPLHGDDVHQLTIQNAAFFLSPAQRITSGPPSKLPERLNHFKAYKIVDGSQASQKVKLTGAFGAEDRTATKAAFLCVPVEQWHHDDHFPVKDPKNYMLVYELLPSEYKASVTTLDQFGINKMKTHDSQWLCVPAKMIEQNPTDER